MYFWIYFFILWKGLHDRDRDYLVHGHDHGNELVGLVLHESDHDCDRGRDYDYGRDLHHHDHQRHGHAVGLLFNDCENDCENDREYGYDLHDRDLHK